MGRIVILKVFLYSEWKKVKVHEIFCLLYVVQYQDHTRVMWLFDVVMVKAACGNCHLIYKTGFNGSDQQLIFLTGAINS